jgi:hypothetical protein
MELSAVVRKTVASSSGSPQRPWIAPTTGTPVAVGAPKTSRVLSVMAWWPRRLMHVDATQGAANS